MADWTKCPHCGLSHSRRADGCCPRCRRSLATQGSALAAPVGGGAGAAPVAFAAAPAAPAAAPARKGALGSVASIAGAVIGVAASRLFGFALLFPAVFGVLAALALAKLGPKRARPFVAAASVFIGHMGWMLVGGIVVGTFEPVAIDLVLMAAGVIWLLVLPGLAPAIAIALYEVASIVVNATQLQSAASTGLRMPLILHILLRLATIAALVPGYLGCRKNSRNVRTAAVASVFE